MEKQKKLSRQIDALIVSCALGMECDETELMLLASEYRSNSKSPYKLNYTNWRSLETDAERETALSLEAKVNDADANHTIGHFYNELGPSAKIFKTARSLSRKNTTPKKSPPKKSPPKTSPKACSRKRCSILGGRHSTRRRRQRQQQRS